MPVWLRRIAARRCDVDGRGDRRAGGQRAACDARRVAAQTGQGERRVDALRPLPPSADVIVPVSPTWPPLSA